MFCTILCWYFLILKEELLFEFNCNVRIVDEIMGRGKRFSAINHINKTNMDEKFLVITPYLTEIERYQKNCPLRKFRQPIYNKCTKIDSLKSLINKEENIIATHALFQKFDNELIDMCRAKNYTLIMDEVANVVEEYQISKDDLEILMNEFVYIDEETNQIKWKPDKDDYYGQFSDIKRLCELGSLGFYGKSIMMWLFPVDAFNAFRNIYILTYMFDAQMQRYYYDYYGLPYEYIHISGDNVDNFHFSKEKDINVHNLDYKSLIHIIDNDKLNHIVHIRNANSKDNLWTTFKDNKKNLQGKGYTKGFLSINMRATNEYRTRTSVAYVANRYMNPVIKNFFAKHNVSVDEDGFALSEMLQFIWRSAIRDKNEIYVYVPSVRMRTLLKKWIEENS